MNDFSNDLAFSHQSEDLPIWPEVCPVPVDVLFPEIGKALRIPFRYEEVK